MRARPAGRCASDLPVDHRSKPNINDVKALMGTDRARQRLRPGKILTSLTATSPISLHCG
jgi:hypothetical protein